jgi:phosphate:Na+ symporter
MSPSFLWEALGGLGLFILGMKSMSDGLQKIAGERLRRFLEKITGNRLTAALMGSCLASLLQSSSAASILVVGFVNAGLISLYQALGVLLGTGIGTTLAIQFIAFKISMVALPAIFVGVILKFFGRKRRWVYVGELLLGAGLVFLGLQTMEAGFAPASESALAAVFHSGFFSWRVSAALCGAALAFLIQSSSAATGIVIALAGSGLVGFETGVAMIIGEVLGASLIAGIATISGTLAAKRTAFVYFCMNVFAVSLVLLFFPVFLSIVHLVSPGEAELTVIREGMTNPSALPQTLRPNIARHLANAHTIFSFLNVLFFLPLLGFFARSAAVILPGREGGLDIEPRPKFIDQRIINTPTIAFLQAKNEVKRMAEIAGSMYVDIVAQFSRFDPKRSLQIRQKEDALDVLQRDISAFLVTLSRQSLPREISVEIPTLLHIINELEHIGDQSEDVAAYLLRKKEDKLYFSMAAMDELKGIAAAVKEMVTLAVSFLENPTGEIVVKMQNLKMQVEHLQEISKNNHLKRLSSGKCTVIAGLLFGDIIACFARIAQFSVNIVESERDFLNVSASGSD